MRTSDITVQEPLCMAPLLFLKKMIVMIHVCLTSDPAWPEGSVLDASTRSQWIQTAWPLISLPLALNPTAKSPELKTLKGVTNVRLGGGDQK